MHKLLRHSCVLRVYVSADLILSFTHTHTAAHTTCIHISACFLAQRSTTHLNSINHADAGCGGGDMGESRESFSGKDIEIGSHLRHVHFLVFCLPNCTCCPLHFSHSSVPLFGMPHCTVVRSPCAPWWNFGNCLQSVWVAFAAYKTVCYIAFAHTDTCLAAAWYALRNQTSPRMAHKLLSFRALFVSVCLA